MATHEQVLDAVDAALSGAGLTVLPNASFYDAKQHPSPAIVRLAGGDQAERQSPVEHIEYRLTVILAIVVRAEDPTTEDATRYTARRTAVRALLDDSGPVWAIPDVMDVRELSAEPPQPDDERGRARFVAQVVEVEIRFTQEQ